MEYCLFFLIAGLLIFDAFTLIRLARLEDQIEADKKAVHKTINRV